MKETFDYVDRFDIEAKTTTEIRSLMACEAVVAEAYWKEIQSYLQKVVPYLKFKGRRGVRELYNKSATDMTKCLS